MGGLLGQTRLSPRGILPANASKKKFHAWPVQRVLTPTNGMRWIVFFNDSYGWGIRGGDKDKYGKDEYEDDKGKVKRGKMKKMKEEREKTKTEKKMIKVKDKMETTKTITKM